MGECFWCFQQLRPQCKEIVYLSKTVYYCHDCFEYYDKNLLKDTDVDWRDTDSPKSRDTDYYVSLWRRGRRRDFWDQNEWMIKDEFPGDQLDLAWEAWCSALGDDAKPKL